MRKFIIPSVILVSAIVCLPALQSHSQSSTLRTPAYQAPVSQTTTTTLRQTTTLSTTTPQTQTTSGSTNRSAGATPGASEAPDFLEDINFREGEREGSIVFDSYDEMTMKNFTEEGVMEIHFSGNVSIRMGADNISARKVIVTVKDGRVIELAAFENVIFKFANQIYLCDSASFDPNTRRGVLRNVRSYLPPSNQGPFSSNSGLSSQTGWYFKAEKATILTDNKVVLEKAFITTSDELYPHWGIYASRIWYFKEEVIFALSITYTIAESDFFWFPFFFQWQNGTGVQTAFGQEKRIGWYMMNTANFVTPRGNFDVNLDLYERLGEYAMTHFKNTKPIGIFQNFDLLVEAADDVRIFKDSANDRYYQYTDPLHSGDLQAIRQFSWHYKLNTTFANTAGNYSINLTWEDLNDPFFLSKFNQRRDSFDIKELIQADQNSFYTYGGDATTPNKSFSRGFTLTANNLSISGNWTYAQKINNEVSNQYMNGRYDYYVNNVTFPTISYAPAGIELLKNVNRSTPTSFKVTISNTNFIVPVDTDIAAFISNYVISINPSFTNHTPVIAYATNLSNRITRTTNRRIVTVKTNTFTNVTIVTNIPPDQPLPNINVATNQYVFYNINSGISAKFNLASSETKNTNGDLTSDQYSHQETGGISFNMGLLNNLINFNNNLSMANLKKWSTFASNQNNNEKLSGLNISLSSSASLNKTGYLLSNRVAQIKFPFSLSHTFNYQLYRTTFSEQPREFSHSSSASTGFNLLKNQIAFSLSGNHNITYRITNAAVMNDTYIDNVKSQNVGASASFKLFWFNISTSASMNILNYRDLNSWTNIGGTNYVYEATTNTMTWDLQGITNRLIKANSYPKLSVSFATPWSEILPLTSKYFPSISFSYTYDILKQTNVSYSVSASYAIEKIKLPLFHELESLNFSANFYYDYLNPRSTRFTLSYSMSLYITKNLLLKFSTQVKNEKIYLYNPDFSPLYYEGEVYTPFWQNFVDSVNIFDYDALKRGLFKIQGLNFDLTHFLDEWELHLIFTVNRLIDETKQIAYWEPSIRVEFNLIGTETQFPAYEHKFVPDELQ